MLTAASPYRSLVAKTPWGAVFSQRISAKRFQSCARSYDGNGRMFFFVPDDRTEAARFAVDVEVRCTDKGPSAVRRVLKGISEHPIKKWTEIEVIAKLAGIPAHIVLRRIVSEVGAYRFPEIEIHRVDTPTHWIALGRLSYRA